MMSTIMGENDPGRFSGKAAVAKRRGRILPAMNKANAACCDKASAMSGISKRLLPGRV
ncbi:hypothetical protein [Chryseobacterium gregarium]|uniref:hypothetical protein n=1 Tax=Chryseobacterium gregarium TaxID=456299 RepID=UPI0012DECC53|nr:hypothetical protein [Chryseobacterium gregarium]